MKRLAAITLILIAPGLLTFAVALGCLSSMPVCHMSGHAPHPCCAKNTTARHNIAVRCAPFEVAPPAMDQRTVVTIPIEAPSAGVANVSSFASPPHTPLRV